MKVFCTVVHPLRHMGAARVQEGGKCALLRERLAFRHTTEVTLDIFGQNSIYGYHGGSYVRFDLSSPKGLRAESARAVTGRQCPHSGEGEDFLTPQPSFFLRKRL